MCKHIFIESTPDINDIFHNLHKMETSMEVDGILSVIMVSSTARDKSTVRMNPICIKSQLEGQTKNIDNDYEFY